MSRILVHVQYLKGIGHLQRVALIAAAAAGNGLEVHIASGGLPVPGFAPEGARLHQLPALQAGPGGFTDLRGGDGAPIDDAWRGARRERLLALFAELAPDLLLTETFPFGRRMLAFELVPLLRAAQARPAPPAVAASIRDILQVDRKPGRAQETVKLLRDCFDAVLVHGDPAFAALDQTFPAAAEIADLLRYTGFVAAPEEAFAQDGAAGRGEVIVSMGAGAIGPRLMETALAARPMTALAGAPWRLITGPHLGEADFARLTAAAPAGVTVERFRADFRRLLAGARLSISYAGYNTCADLLRARVRAVLVTYGGEAGGETEQAMRAVRMEGFGLASALSDRELTPASLARAIDAACAAPAPPDPGFHLDGAARSAELLRAWTEARAGG